MTKKKGDFKPKLTEKTPLDYIVDGGQGGRGDKEPQVLDGNEYKYDDKYTHTEIGKIPRALPAKPQGERKSRRLNLLVRPTMYEELARIAAQRSSSVNDLINIILEDFTARNMG